MGAIKKIKITQGIHAGKTFCKTVYCIYWEDWLLQELDDICLKENRSRSQQISHVMKQFLIAQKEPKE